SPPGKSEISTRNPTKRERTFIRGRNRECSSVAHTFTLPTAASIVIASRCAPIISPTISNKNGAIAAANHAITFSTSLSSCEKCGWARTSQTSARAHPRQRNLRRRPQAALLLQLVGRARPRRLRRARQRLQERLLLLQQPRPARNPVRRHRR